jgi:hypothetical protein
MGEAKRRKAILGDRYGKNGTPKSNTNESSEVALIKDILRNHVLYRYRFSVVDDQVIEDTSLRIFTESWCVSQLRQHPNVFEIVYEMLGDGYSQFHEDVIVPAVGDNIGVYHVESKERVFCVNCKTEEEAFSRLGILFLRGEVKSLSDCAFVFHRWDIEPSERLDGDRDIRDYVLDKISIRLGERLIKSRTRLNLMKKKKKLEAAGVREDSVWELIAQKLHVCEHRLVWFLHTGDFLFSRMLVR